MHTLWFLITPLFKLLRFSTLEYYTAARFEKESRYYVIRLSKDLLGDWIITLINGRIKSKLGQSRTLAFTDFNEGFRHFCALSKIRYQRGYQVKTIACDNLLLLHLVPMVLSLEEKQKLPVKKTITPRERQDKKLTTEPNKVIAHKTQQQMSLAF